MARAGARSCVVTIGDKCMLQSYQLSVTAAVLERKNTMKPKLEREMGNWYSTFQDVTFALYSFLTVEGEADGIRTRR